MEKKPSYIDTFGPVSKPKKDSGATLYQRMWALFSGGQGLWKARADDAHEKPLTDMVKNVTAKIGFKEAQPIFIFKSEKPQALNIPGGQLALSTGLLEALTPEQVEAIVARQFVRKYHALRDSAVAGAIVGAEFAFEIGMSHKIHNAIDRITHNPAAQLGLQVAEKLATTTGALMLEHAYERSCEYEADIQGAKALGSKPAQMIDALEAMEEGHNNYEVKRRLGMSSWRRTLSETKDKYAPSWVQRVWDTGNPFEALNSEPSLAARVRSLKTLEAQPETGQSTAVSR